jgi:hypothetical protein
MKESHVISSDRFTCGLEMEVRYWERRSAASSHVSFTPRRIKPDFRIQGKATRKCAGHMLKFSTEPCMTYFFFLSLRSSTCGEREGSRVLRGETGEKSF